MKQGIGMTQTLNIIILFILTAFAILMGIMSYSKAFRTSSRIVKSIEVCEGYNDCAKEQIYRFLSNIGYNHSQSSCPNKDSIVAYTHDDGFDYCVYMIDENVDIQGSSGYCNNDQSGCGYARYEVLTYMTFDFPIIDKFKIPVRNRTDWIYRFPNDRQ